MDEDVEDGVLPPAPDAVEREIVTPVGERPRISSRTRTISRSALCWVVGLSSASTALLALVASLAFFSEFVATDPEPLQLLQAGALSLGVGSLLIVPFAVMAWWALRRGRAPLLWTVLLMLPWAVIGGMWVVIGRFDPFVGAVPAIVALLAMLWVLREGPDFGSATD